MEPENRRSAFMRAEKSLADSMKAIVTCKIIFATLVSGHDLFETSALLLSLYVALFKLITNCSVILVAQKLLLWAKFYFFTQQGMEISHPMRIFPQVKPCLLNWSWLTRIPIFS